MTWTSREIRNNGQASRAQLPPQRSCPAFLKHSVLKTYPLKHFYSPLFLALFPLLSLHPVKSGLTFNAPDIFLSIIHFGARTIISPFPIL